MYKRPALSPKRGHALHLINRGMGPNIFCGARNERPLFEKKNRMPVVVGIMAVLNKFLLSDVSRTMNMHIRPALGNIFCVK